MDTHYPQDPEWLKVDIEKFVNSIHNNRQSYKDIGFAKVVDQLQELVKLDYSILDNTWQSINLVVKEDSADSLDIPILENPLQCDQNDDWTNTPPKRTFLEHFFNFIILIFSCNPFKCFNPSADEGIAIPKSLQETSKTASVSESEDLVEAERLANKKWRFVLNMMRIARTSMVAPDRLMQFQEEETTYPEIIQLYQQVAEKSLKALYFAYSYTSDSMTESPIFNTHDCNWIVKQMKNVDYEVIDYLKSAARPLDDLGRQEFDKRSLCTRSRYMKNVTDDYIPKDLFTAEDAQAAMNLTHQIFECCEHLIG